MHRATAALLWVVLFGAASAVLAADDATLWEKEKKEAAEEDARNDALPMDKRVSLTITGTFTPADSKAAKGANPDVLGTLATSDRTYTIKARTPDLARRLNSGSAKRVTVTGVLRNGEKYFVVDTIVELVPGVNRNRRGL